MQESKNKYKLKTIKKYKTKYPQKKETKDCFNNDKCLNNVRIFKKIIYNQKK